MREISSGTDERGSTMRIAFARACRLAAPLAAALLVPTLWASPVKAETRDIEKPDLKLGFIKLTDMAPLAIAYDLDIEKFRPETAAQNWPVVNIASA